MNARSPYRFAISRLILLLLVLQLGSLVQLSRASSQDLPSPTLLSNSAVHTWVTQTGIAVDPRLTLELSQVMHAFLSIYGFDADSRPKVTSLLANQNRVNWVVATYLNDIVSLSNPTIRSPLDRFASEIGSRAHQAGWPDAQWNPYRYIPFPARSRPNTLIAPETLGGNQLARIGFILGYGNHLIAAGDKHHTLSLLPQGDRIVMATMPTDSVPSDESAGTYQVVPDPSFYCPIGPGAPPDRGRQTSRRSGTRPAEVAPFYQASAVSVQVSDENSICGLGCQQALAFVVVQAISQWKVGCRRCRDVALRAIRVGNSVWLTSKLLRLLSYELDTGRDSTNTFVEDPDTMQQLGDLVHYGLQFPLGYHKVGGTALAEKLCLGDLGRLVGSTAFTWLCEADVNSCLSPSCIQFTLALGQRSASCDLGNDARYGCAVADQSVAINTDYYLFTVPVGTGSPTVVGSGTELIDIRNLILHEVGHWFRLPHSSTTVLLPKGWDDVMAYQPDITRELCITLTSMGHIDEAINDAWKDKLPREEGFSATMEPSVLIP